MEAILCLLMGLGLAAACGFRVFVPLLVVNLAARSGHLELASGLSWMAGDTSLLVFAVATVLEVLGYFVPWVDNMLDTIATPAAIVAGSLVMASSITDMSPIFKWTLAIVAGGGVAGMVQAATVGVRAVSSATTAGLGNPVVSTSEAAASAVLSIAALLAPLIAGLAVLVLAVWAVRKLIRLLVGRRQQQAVQIAP